MFNLIFVKYLQAHTCYNVLIYLSLSIKRINDPNYVHHDTFQVNRRYEEPRVSHRGRIQRPLPEGVAFRARYAPVACSHGESRHRLSPFHFYGRGSNKKTHCLSTYYPHDIVPSCIV